MNNTKTQTTMPTEFVKISNELSKKFEMGFSAEMLYSKVAEKITANARQGAVVSPNDVYSFMLECKTLNLNPLAKHIYGFLNGGKVCTIVSIDGWREIANREPNYDGYEFIYGDMAVKTLAYDSSSYTYGQKIPKTVTVERKVCEWIECKIFLKNRSRPVTFRTYFEEAFRPSQPWACQPIQMLQNKALVNAIKNAFSISAYTEDDREFIEQPIQPMYEIQKQTSPKFEIQSPAVNTSDTGFLDVEQPDF